MSKGSRTNSTLAPERYSATKPLARFSSAPEICPLHFTFEWAFYNKIDSFYNKRGPEADQPGPKTGFADRAKLLFSLGPAYYISGYWRQPEAGSGVDPRTPARVGRRDTSRQLAEGCRVDPRTRARRETASNCRKRADSDTGPAERRLNGMVNAVYVSITLMVEGRRYARRTL